MVTGNRRIWGMFLERNGIYWEAVYSLELKGSKFGQAVEEMVAQFEDGIAVALD